MKIIIIKIIKNEIKLAFLDWPVTQFLPIYTKNGEKKIYRTYPTPNGILTFNTYNRQLFDLPNNPTNGNIKRKRE